MSELTCPGCGRAMRSLALPRTPLAPLSIDACDDCQALWLDATESQQLTPGAVIALFRAIGSSQPTRRDAYPALLPCPRCTTPLTLTQDLQHTTRFTYYRCRYGHGRFTPYVQFLREKNFIRQISVADLDKLKKLVRIIRCSSCGAPVDLSTQTACSYCRAPIAVLDPDAVASTLRELDAAAARRAAITSPDAAATSILAGALFDQAMAREQARDDRATGIDLVGVGLGLLASLAFR